MRLCQLVGTLHLPHAATLPPTAVDASVNPPPATAVGDLPATSMLPPFLPAGTIPPSESAHRGRGCGLAAVEVVAKVAVAVVVLQVRNYRNAILIDIIDDIHPICNNHWELVLQRYLEASGEDDPREVKDLKAHRVNKLRNNFKKPTGRTSEMGDRINICIKIEHFNLKLTLLFMVHHLERKRGKSI